MYLKVVIRWNLVTYPMLIMGLPVELIGEEIYDEFDQEGAYGDRVPYESTTDTRDGDVGDPEDPYHLLSITNQRVLSDSISWNDQTKSPVTELPTSLKGLEFFRTRSAPPVPREMGTEKYVRDDKVTGRGRDKMDDEQDSTARGRDPTAIQMPKPIKGTGRYPPSVILEQHSTISSYDSTGPTIISVEAKGLTVPPSTHQDPPSLVVTAPAPTRLAPPAPSSRPQTALSTQTMSTLPTLEAILLERKRRASYATNSSSPVPSGPHINPPLISTRPASLGLIHSVPGNPVAPLRVHSSGKGARFKSSPLGGGDRAGVVVTEQLKAARKSEDVDQEQKEDKQVEKASLGKD
jgi:metal transporter CNNM